MCLRPGEAGAGQGGWQREAGSERSPARPLVALRQAGAVARVALRQAGAVARVALRQAGAVARVALRQAGAVARPPARPPRAAQAYMDRRSLI